MPKEVAMRLNKRERKAVSEAIEDILYYTEGLHLHSGHAAKIANLKVTKTSYIADVKIVRDMGEDIEILRERYFKKESVDAHVKKLRMKAETCNEGNHGEI